MLSKLSASVFFMRRNFIPGETCWMVNLIDQRWRWEFQVWLTCNSRWGWRDFLSCKKCAWGREPDDWKLASHHRQTTCSFADRTINQVWKNLSTLCSPLCVHIHFLWPSLLPETNLDCVSTMHAILLHILSLSWCRRAQSSSVCRWWWRCGIGMRMSKIHSIINNGLSLEILEFSQTDDPVTLETHPSTVLIVDINLQWKINKVSFHIVRHAMRYNVNLKSVGVDISLQCAANVNAAESFSISYGKVNLLHSQTQTLSA